MSNSNKQISEILEASVHQLFLFLKNSSTIKECWLNSIEVNQDLFLVPVANVSCEDSELVNFLTSWRNTYRHTYPTQFTATTGSTKTWLLNNVLQNSNKILFQIIDGSNQLRGHIGLNLTDKFRGIIEIDNVAKCPKTDLKGIMSASLLALIKWSRETLPVEYIELKVLESNTKAINFYKKNHFSEINKIPLKRICEEDKISLVHDNDGSDDQFVVMRFMDNTLPGKSMILTAGPSISQMESSMAYDAAANGWNAKWSGYLSKFESEFADFVGAKHAIATSSCTGALQIALLSLEIGPGDEVIVPEETWVASATAVRDVGATPVFCDVDLTTYNLSVESVRSKISNNTRAIIPVHMYGNPADMTRLIELSIKHSLNIVEDGAPAMGAKIGNRYCGTFGEFGCFSFQGAKMLVTGEGGMLVTDDAVLYQKAKKIADQGRNPEKTFWIDGPGVKYKMSNVQAAIGLAQVRRAEPQIFMKQRINRWYREHLSELNCIEFQDEYNDCVSINWMTSIRLRENSPITRDQLMQRLKSMNIDTRPLFPAISQYPIWNRSQQANKNALILGKTAMNLPSGVKLNFGEVEYICNCIKLCLEH
jgi:perosamine synthetase